MKKILLLILIFLMLPTNYSNYIVFANPETNFNQTLQEQLDNLNTDSLEQILEVYGNKELSLLGEDLKKFLNQTITGENIIDYKNIFKFIIISLTNQLKDNLPLFSTIIAVGILISLVKEFNLNKREDISSIINISFIGIVTVICIVQVSNFIFTTKENLLGINNQMQAIFPILLTTMTALGSSKSVSFFQPVLAILCNFIINFMINFLLPIIILSLVLSICSNISNNLKLNKLNDFLINFFKWSLGIIFTLFIAFVTIQGISVSTFDSISIRTAKFTIRSFIPLVGGFLSDTFNIIMASSILIKNAIGLTGLLILFSSLIVPIISMLCFKLGLELTSGLLEPVCDTKLCDLLIKLSKILTFLISIIVICALMFLIMVTIIMSTSNVLR